MLAGTTTLSLRGAIAMTAMRGSSSSSTSVPAPALPGAPVGALGVQHDLRLHRAGSRGAGDAFPPARAYGRRPRRREGDGEGKRGGEEDGKATGAGQVHRVDHPSRTRPVP